MGRALTLCIYWQLTIFTTLLLFVFWLYLIYSFLYSLTPHNFNLLKFSKFPQIFLPLFYYQWCNFLFFNFLLFMLFMIFPFLKIILRTLNEMENIKEKHVWLLLKICLYHKINSYFFIPKNKIWRKQSILRGRRNSAFFKKDKIF